MPKNAPQTAAIEQDLPTMTLTWIVRALRKGWYMMVAAVILGGALALLYSKTLPKVYQASSLIEFVPDVVKPMGSKEDSGRYWGMMMDTREYYETQYYLMTSDLVLGKIVRDLNLQSDKDFLGFKPTKPVALTDAVAMLRDRVRVDPIKMSRRALRRHESGHGGAAVRRTGEGVRFAEQREAAQRDHRCRRVAFRSARALSR
jgi:uncharacterized protein involved in exopolysaccharide biosynthesis